MDTKEIVEMFKSAGFQGRIFTSMEDARKARENEPPYRVCMCNYKGIKRHVHPAVCEWHKQEKDPECTRCTNSK